MKYCPNCGMPTEEGQKFCGECGANLLDAELPKEPVYTDDERLKNDPVLNPPQSAFGAAKKKAEKVPELTLEPDLWGLGSAAAATEPEKKEKKTPELTLEPDVWGHGSAAAAAAAPAETETPAEAPAAAAAVQQLPPVGQTAASAVTPLVEDFDYERPDAEYHGPAQGTQGDYHAPRAETYDLPNDYTMSGQPAQTAGKMPDETLMLIWSIILSCVCSVCGIVGLVKTVKARKTMDYAMKYKLLSSAKIWLIVGTVLHILPFLAEIF